MNIEHFLQIMHYELRIMNYFCIFAGQKEKKYAS